MKDCIFLSQQVIEPAYQLLSFYLRNLALACACLCAPLSLPPQQPPPPPQLRLTRARADDNLKGKDRIVPGLHDLFGQDSLPGRVVR